MSSEKPFWKGKTCGELEGLRVKITWNNGDTMTSTLDMVGNVAHCVSLSPAIRSSSTFVPYSGIKSIELVDDPEYERIDNIEDVREGDEVFTLSGNKYKARAVYESMEVYADGDGFSPIIQRKYFAYALRPKPKLPDHDGLWLDKDDAIWQVCDHQAVPVYDDADEWGLQREVFSVSQLGQYAPFRPAKAVEA
ncbi:hypothetical protein ACJ8MW_02370 [Bifidobacterium longum subsp. longum]|uniref:hypothetical protein n=1 Tax=Bifidobacterium longum TaxID=216816 RepID=UPI003B9D28B6